MQIIKSKNIILFFVLIMLTNSTYAKFYRWVDENGKVHYSDKLPPEQAKGAHEKISSDGVSTNRVNRAKTSAEKAALKAEEEKVVAERKRKASIEAKQRAKDKILLDIFSSEEDLLYTRDDRLTAIQSLISIRELNNKRLKERLKPSLNARERLLKANKEVPENITDTITSIQSRIDKNDSDIVAQQKKYQKIDEEFAADLKRYRELKNIVPEDGQLVVDQSKKASGSEKVGSDKPSTVDQTPAAAPSKAKD